jgi:hypothetical protein
VGNAESFAALYMRFNSATSASGIAKLKAELRELVALVVYQEAVSAGYREDCKVRVRVDGQCDARGVRHIVIFVGTETNDGSNWKSSTELRVALYPGIPAQITVKKHRFGSDPTMNTKNMTKFIKGLATEMNWRWNP